MSKIGVTDVSCCDVSIGITESGSFKLKRNNKEISVNVVNGGDGSVNITFGNDIESFIFQSASWDDNLAPEIIADGFRVTGVVGATDHIVVRVFFSN